MATENTASPLHEYFRSAGAKCEDVSGWQVPSVVTDEECEYFSIRKGVGISDLSDMAKIRISGEGAKALLDEVTSGNIDRLVENNIRWTAILDERGRVVSDVQVYNDFDSYLITCSGPQRATTLRALQRQRADDVQIEDRTETLAALSVEGPLALEIPEKIAGMDAAGLRLLAFTRLEIQGTESIVSRIGYTGEFGYVFFVDPGVAVSILDQIRRMVPESRLCGRAVQALLRLEVRAFDLEHHVVKGETALQAGLHWMIDFRKRRFIGRESIMAEKSKGPPRRLVALVFDGETVVDRGATIFDDEREVGYVAQCAWSPTLQKTIGLAYLDDAYAWVGIELRLTNSRYGPRARTVSTPFFVTASTRIAAQ